MTKIMMVMMMMMTIATDDDCNHTALETFDTLRPPWSGCCNPWQAWFSRYDMLLM